MAGLTGLKWKNKYKDVVIVDNANAGIDTTLRPLKDGEGTTSSLFISTTKTQFGSGLLSDANDIVVNIAQPAFLARNSADDDNVTGDGTVATVDFDTEIFDQGSDFAADEFTAPVTGKYQLDVNVKLVGITAAATSVSISIVTSNRPYSHTDEWQLAGGRVLRLSVLADMDAADTVTVTVTVVGEASDVVDVKDASFFSGFLAA